MSILNNPESHKLPHPIVWTILYLPFGALGGFVGVALAFLATNNGLSITEGSLIIGSQLLVSYTWSKAEDDVNDFTSQPNASGTGRNPADPNGLPAGFLASSERGPSARDQRHRFVASGVVDLSHGFTASAIVEAGSGRPYNITAGQDLNGDGNPDTDRPRTAPADPASVIGRKRVRATWPS